MSAGKTNLFHEALEVRVPGKSGQVDSAGLAGHAVEQVGFAAPCTPGAQLLLACLYTPVACCGYHLHDTKCWFTTGRQDNSCCLDDGKCWFVSQVK